MLLLRPAALCKAKFQTTMESHSLDSHNLICALSAFALRYNLLQRIHRFIELPDPELAGSAILQENQEIAASSGYPLEEKSLYA